GVWRQPLTRQLWMSAALGAVIVAFNLKTLFWGRIGYSDMLLNACLGGSLLAFFLGYAQPERRAVQARWYITFYVLIALAVLTKGPVGIVLPGLIIGTFLLYLGKGQEVLREMQLVRGALIVLVLVVPWYVLVIAANGKAYLNSFFGYHNLERFTHVVNQHAGPWYFHAIVIFIGFLPWSVYLPAAIAQLQFWARRQWQQQPRAAHLGLFSFFWFLGIIGFFTIAATKYFSYVLPAIPAAAILVALWWSQQITQRLSRPYDWHLRLTTLGNIGLFLVLAGVSLYSPHWLGNDPTMPNLGLRMQQAKLPLAGALIWSLSAIAGGFLLLRRRPQWLWSVNLIGFVAFWIFVLTPVAQTIDTERQLPLRQIAQTAVQVEHPGEALIMIVTGFPKPSLVFYTQQPVTFLPTRPQASELQQIIAKQSKSQSALVIAPPAVLAQIGLGTDQYQAIRQAGLYQLIRVTPH
ncbi:MAG TPA: hypothetical protein V6D03_10525, partial [Candidatus Caenarcaniphilales bacterium]